MKLCPKCQANVEGLIHHCDCCGASLDTQIHLFACICHDLPECLGFSALAFGMLNSLEPSKPIQYTEYIEKIVFEVFCYPESIILSEKIRNRVFYSSTKRLARVTAIVDYDEFIYSNHSEKASLVADAIYQGILLLQARLKKDRLNINEIVTAAETMLRTGAGSLS